MGYNYNYYYYHSSIPYYPKVGLLDMVVVVVVRPVRRYSGCPSSTTQHSITQCSRRWHQQKQGSIIV